MTSQIRLTSGEDLAYRTDVVQSGPIIADDPIYYLSGTGRQPAPPFLAHAPLRKDEHASHQARQVVQ